MAKLLRYMPALALAIVGFFIIQAKMPEAELQNTTISTQQNITEEIASNKEYPTPGFGEKPEPLGYPPIIENPSPNTDYSFQALNPDGSPVTFSPCRPIHFVIRQSNAPEDGNKKIMSAVLEVSKATGLKFIYDGETDEPPNINREGYQPKRYGDRWAPVLIAWSNPIETPGFTTDLIGEATTYQLVRPDGYAHYVTGQVILDANRLQKLEQDYGTKITSAVLKHELGHLVGLGHTEADNQLMYPKTSPGIEDFQAGDYTGLAELGRGSCADDI
jgi:hypothetical protein